MNKKAYQKPAMQAVNINMSHQLLAGSSVSSLGGNSGMKLGGASSNATDPSARSRGGDDWDDED